MDGLSLSDASCPYFSVNQHAIMFSICGMKWVRKMMRFSKTSLGGQSRWCADGAVLFSTLLNAKEIVPGFAAVLKEFH